LSKHGKKLGNKFKSFREILLFMCISNNVSIRPVYIVCVYSMLDPGDVTGCRLAGRAVPLGVNAGCLRTATSSQLILLLIMCSVLVETPDGKRICDLPKHGHRPTSDIRQFCSTLWTQAASISKSAR
jgi:hypothetical protein